jgi:hypothetical protein
MHTRNPVTRTRLIYVPPTRNSERIKKMQKYDNNIEPPQQTPCRQSSCKWDEGATIAPQLLRVFIDGG